MDSTKYIGMDVHKESISIAVRNAAGKIVMEGVIETKANMILEFVDGLRGNVHVAKQHKIYGNAQKSALKSTAIVPTEPILRITAPMQAEIIRLYMEGCSLCEIARQTGRARQTVTKVARRLDVEAKIREMKEKLLAESDAWLESINFAVTHEMDGALALRLCTAFGIVPSLSKKATPVKPQNEWEPADPWKRAAAKALGQIASERASVLRLENDELEKLVRKDQEKSERTPTPRLFDSRD